MKIGLKLGKLCENPLNSSNLFYSHSQLFERLVKLYFHFITLLTAWTIILYALTYVPRTCGKHLLGLFSLGTSTCLVMEKGSISLTLKTSHDRLLGLKGALSNKASDS